nr:immunoglobulin light chain junction region [Mus musculus]NSL98722.1 immunoglobulin light chain junction region [Mus musculus]NSL99040.1 immunoglobulin light chain junction region [Mus musculus]NSL99835.1 immunoglobulin light chain junction region [Mus musculus]NSL99875.1 immunoglobulin light chain junction region [Mus musculus]
CQNDHSYPFTF